MFRDFWIRIHDFFLFFFSFLTPGKTCQLVPKIGVYYSGVTHGVDLAHLQAYPFRLT